MRRQGNTVIIEIPSQAFDELLLALGYAAGGAGEAGNMALFKTWLRLVNVINEGNPHFTPYEVKD